jgi:hypothetical protein
VNNAGWLNNRVWLNDRMPQTLYISQLLLYFRGVFGLLTLPALGSVVLFGSKAVAAVVILLASFGALGGAYGIANTRKWGYQLGVAAAFTPFVIRVQVALDFGLGDALSYNPIGLLFDLALVGLLLHRMSGEYQRLYFR